MRSHRRALACGVLTVVAAYLLVGQYRIDLDVYRIGARALLRGTDLYGPLPPTRDGLLLAFTYPPAAALLFVPLALLPFPVASAGLTLASVAALAGTLALVNARLDHARLDPAGQDHARLGPGRLDPAGRSRPPLLLLLLVALLLEPVGSTLGYGQINLILLVLVCADLLLGSTPWPRGVLLGLAAAIKLTPAGFVLTLLVLRQWRAAATAAATFLVVTLGAWLVAPEDSQRYWTSTLWDPGRIGGAIYAGNQSLKATVLRADLAPQLAQAVYLGALLAALVATVVAMRRTRAGQHVLLVGLNALLILLVSPVSWTHHWVWLPLVALGLRQAPGTRRGRRLLALAGVALALTSPMKWLPREHDAELAWAPWQVILGNAYVLYAVLVLAAVLLSKPAPSGARRPAAHIGGAATRSGNVEISSAEVAVRRSCSSGVSSSSAAAADERAVVGRVLPGMTIIVGDRPSSQASATC